jgi:regulator of protease activity HflC (stomatin/prohibitin superfamily)
VLLVLAVTLGCFYVVEPGERGVHVTLGTMSEQFVAPQVVGAGSNILLPLARPAE